MKKFKRIMALVIAMAMVVAMALPSFAADYGASNSHTITIKHNEATGAHTYSAYQIFKGNLDAKEDVLSDIQWGSAITEAGKSGIVTDLKALLNDADGAAATHVSEGKIIDASNNEIIEISKIASAADVAKVLSVFADDSKALDAFAQIVAKQTDGAYDYISTKAGTGSIAAGSDEGTINVTGDGYYMIIDDTTTLADGDTYSKIMLNVVKDVTVKVKDDSIKPDKEIVDDTNENGSVDATDERVKANTSAVGDTVTYEVKVTVPDTTNYNTYKFVMKDQLPAGLTFDAIQSIKVFDGTTETKSLTAATSTTTGAAGTYVVTTTTQKDGEGNPTGYAAPATITDKVASGTGGQAIKIVFNKFKELAEGTPNLIGKEIVVTYTAIVNADATYGAEYNENTVKFDFTNNPNHQYDGTDSDFKDGEPQGSTPEDKTQTYVTTLEIFKYTTEDGETKTGLAGAEFEITSEEYNAVVKSGVKYEKAPYTAVAGETIEAGNTYYKLKDGSYTTAVPGAQIKDDNGALLYVEADGVTITTDATYTDDNGDQQNNTPYVYNETQYADKVDGAYETYVKVSYKVVDKTPVTVSGDKKKYTVISGNDGKINLNGLQPGVYTIEETHAPDGYNKIDTKYELTIAWVDIGTTDRSVATTDPAKTADEVIEAAVKAELSTLKTAENLGIAEDDAAIAQAKANGGFFVAKAVAIDGNTRKAAEAGTFALTYTHAATTTPAVTPQDNGGKYKIDILNLSGTELPSTGGIGTTIFYVVGAILVIGAGVVLITRRRMDA